MAVVLIGKIRKEKGVSLNQLAKLTGISSSTLRNYENQKQSPRMDRLEKKAIALEVAIEDLFESDYK